MKLRLVSLGGLVYLPNLPDRLVLSIPEPGTSFEILDVPFGDGRNYDQTRFVCRETAESLAAKYPDMWKIEEVPC